MTKKFIQYGIMIVIVISSTVFLRTFVNAALYGPVEDALEIPYFVRPTATTTDQGDRATSTDPKKISARLKADSPTRLLIPALGVSASVQRVGLNSKGAMGVPSNYRDVAWYSKGTVPGDAGSAVIAGHLDNGLGLSGVFKDLTEIKTGDEVVVERLSGKKHRFIVTDIREYNFDDPEASTIFEGDGQSAMLRLVTCGGSWLAEHRTYEKRVIVTAVLAQ